MNSITIILPVSPPAVRPNGRPHWREKAKVVKAMRKSARDNAWIYWTPLSAAFGGLDPWTHASIKIDWYHPTITLLDRDNIIASCKAYLDGIVDAGVLSDDRDVTFEPVGRFKDAKNPRVEITITPIDEVTD